MIKYFAKAEPEKSKIPPSLQKEQPRIFKFFFMFHSFKIRNMLSFA